MMKMKIGKEKNQNKIVALKSLNNSKNVTLEFMNEVLFINSNRKFESYFY